MSKTKTKTQVPEDMQLIPEREAMGILGIKAVDTIRRMRREKQLRAVVIGKNRYHYTMTELRRFMGLE